MEEVCILVDRLDACISVQGQPLYQTQVSFRRNEHKDAVPWEAVPKGLDRIGAPAVEARTVAGAAGIVHPRKHHPGFQRIISADSDCE